MTSLSFVIRKMLSDIGSYCCLCFKSIEENTSFFSIDDQVSLNVDKTEEMSKILSTVLGDHVIDNISTQIICQHCTETAMKSYRFIQQCRNNIQKMQVQVECLLNHTRDIDEGIGYFKSLYLDLDTSTGNVVSYYDTDQKCNSVSKMFERFKNILKESKQVSTKNEYESDCSAVDKKEETNTMDSLKLSDIIYDKNNLDNLKCKACLKLYPTKFNLKQHYVRMHLPKDFKCSKCPRSFGTLGILNGHIKNSHCKVVCFQCGKSYTNTYSLRSHESSHKLQLVCETCGKMYKGKLSFVKHIKLKLCQKMRKSNSEAKFICNYCGKKYAQKAALSSHIRVDHENGKALTCDWCGKRHSAISRLKDHIITHTKQKNFECDLCKEKFVTKTSLLYHTRTHTGEKPYKCDQCDMAFLSASRRKDHVNRHHMPTLVECDICHGKYKGTRNLVQHRKKHFDVKCKLYKKPVTN